MVALLIQPKAPFIRLTTLSFFLWGFFLPKHETPVENILEQSLGFSDSEATVTKIHSLSCIHFSLYISHLYIFCNFLPVTFQPWPNHNITEIQTDVA